MKVKDSNKTRIIGWIVSVALLSAAVFTIWSRWDDLSKAIESIERPNLWSLTSLPCITLLAVACVSESFRSLLNRKGVAKEGSKPIGRNEMFWLIMVAGMLNWLPMRAGLIGRTVYHSKVNGIPASSSLRILVETIVILICMAIVALSLAVLSNIFSIPVLIALVFPVLVLLPLSCKTQMKPFSLAITFRYLDVLLLALRYWIIFGLMDYDISPETAILLAGAGSIASLLPLPTGGLGGREWIIGLVASWVTVFPSAIALGLIADLVNRLVELVVVIPFGLLGQHFLRKIPPEPSL
ncbi:MAG: hypothetical protein H8E91_04710 [Planctomycetes bacterium]|nr:hypothetical protein [Planctomycetota bacterium]